jgi:hypothetical protein
MLWLQVSRTYSPILLTLLLTLPRTTPSYPHPSTYSTIKMAPPGDFKGKSKAKAQDQDLDEGDGDGEEQGFPPGKSAFRTGTCH